MDDFVAALPDRVIARIELSRRAVGSYDVVLVVDNQQRVRNGIERALPALGLPGPTRGRLPLLGDVPGGALDVRHAPFLVTHWRSPIAHPTHGTALGHDAILVLDGLAAKQAEQL